MNINIELCEDGFLVEVDGVFYAVMLDNVPAENLLNAFKQMKEFVTTLE